MYIPQTVAIQLRGEDLVGPLFFFSIFWAEVYDRMHICVEPSAKLIFITSSNLVYQSSVYMYTDCLDPLMM